MSQQEAAALVEYLADQVAEGYTLLTWNGLGFDFDVLAEEAQMLEHCRALALAHVDMMFHAFCQLGHGVGLDAAARGMGLRREARGHERRGRSRAVGGGEAGRGLRYVAQDVQTTLDLATALRSLWRASLGRPQRQGAVDGFAEGMADGSEALELPLPDTSWMSDPWSREKFTGWMG